MIMIHQHYIQYLLIAKDKYLVQCHQINSNKAIIHDEHVGPTYPNLQVHKPLEPQVPPLRQANDPPILQPSPQFR